VGPGNISAYWVKDDLCRNNLHCTFAHVNCIQLKSDLKKMILSEIGIDGARKYSISSYWVKDDLLQKYLTLYFCLLVLYDT
jgi:hypothetical protein